MDASSCLSLFEASPSKTVEENQGPIKRSIQLRPTFLGVMAFRRLSEYISEVTQGAHYRGNSGKTGELGGGGEFPAGKNQGI